MEESFKYRRVCICCGEEFITTDVLRDHCYDPECEEETDEEPNDHTEDQFSIY